MQPPVIVVHGITGSVLRDVYPTTPEVVWDPGIEALRWRPIKEFNRIAMHPDDLRYEAIGPANILPSHAAELGYAELIRELRSALREDRGPQAVVPVFPFAYDWRADNRVVAGRLCEFVREVIDRTNLLKTYAKEKATTVDLVGHSMGGLVIAAALAKGCKDAKGKPLVRRVVTIGTPFQGAVDSVIKLATGEGSMVGSPHHSERLAARMTPAIYHLLPYFDGALAGHSGKAIFKDKNWQESIVESVADFIKTHSTDPKHSTAEQRMKSAWKYLRDRLDDGRSFLESVNSDDPTAALAEQGQWLLIVGLDERTAYRVRLSDGGRFAFDAEEKEYRGEGGPPANVDGWRGNLGDGTVPLDGAVPEWADRHSIVGVAERDFGGFLGFGENLPLRKGMSLHASLPLMNLVQRWTISFLRGSKWGDLWGRPLPGLPIKDWTSPVPGGSPELYDYQKPAGPA